GRILTNHWAFDFTDNLAIIEKVSTCMGGSVMIFGLKLKNIVLILFGSAIFSFGIVHFNMQNNLGEGGFTGITLLFYFLWKWDPAISNFVLNVPVFFIGWKFLGRN